MEDNQAKPNKRSVKTWLFVVAAIGIFAFGVLFGNGTLSFGLIPRASNNKNVNLNQFWQVWDLLYKKYDGDIDQNKLIEGATKGMVASLGDPYTEYLTQRQADDLNNDLNGKLSGIGVEVGIKNDRLTIIAPIDDTPAAKAGLKAGDIITSIDGTESSGLTLDEAVRRIRGEAGTKVKLMIVTPGKNAREVEIIRDNINVASVKTEIKPDGIGYMRIRRFGEDTAEKVNSAATNFKNSNVKGVIIDVRDNPGGYLDSSVNISSQFLSDGKKVVEERSKFKDNKVLKALPDGMLTDLPVVILINGGSASASEILAGALHDNGRASLVGEKSYGKGSVQEVIKLPGGSELKVTVAHWYTPNGINISKEGIRPDFEVKNGADDYNLNRDPQLDKAIEIIKSKIKK